MSWTEKVWGSQREDQIKGLLLLGLVGFFTVVVAVLFSLRLVGFGEAVWASFYIYLSILLAVSAVCVFFKANSLALFALMVVMVELVIGVGPLVLQKLGVDSPVRAFVAESSEIKDQYVFHPLLGGIPNPGLNTENIQHTHTGLRASDLPFDERKSHIAVFGGSTTYDIGVDSDKNTWVSELGRLLPEYTVTNNGVPGYSSMEHVVQTAFYSDRAGSMPVCSIYYLGWNDIRSFGLESLDSGYADFHMPSQYGNLRVRQGLATPSAILNIVGPYFWRTELPFPNTKGTLGKSIQDQDAVFERVEHNLESIHAMNRVRGIRTIFIGQLLNMHQLVEKDRTHQWVPFVYSADVWPLQQRMNALIKTTAKRLGSSYIGLDIDAFKNEDFADKGHFSNQGAIKFAGLLKEPISRLCKSPI